ncbi:hypothetical protein ACIQBJ_03295 [Kitasatospora sp. NPDC088391]|uniref:5'-methylthioadenosine/S-adenosylhomocysteine nucleosidase family protein n=1 Tax=Kitasatospora sp. NPDC088391 TaxID=3364074 RepID=UPI0038107590
MGSVAEVVVLTALPVEARAVEDLLVDREPLVHPEGTRAVRGRLPGTSGSVAVVRSGTGNLGTAAIAERVRTWLEPRALLFVGVAGGLKPEVRLGDVVVATVVHHAHPGKETSEGFRARPATSAASHVLEQTAGVALGSDTWWVAAPDLPSAHPPQVHFKPIVAAEVVLNSLDAPLRNQIDFHYGDAVAVEMESAGLYRVADLSRDLQVLTLRGISDHADEGKAGADAAGSQHRASVHAAAALRALLLELEPRPAPAPLPGSVAPSAPAPAPAPWIGATPAEPAPSPPDAELVDALMAFDDMSRTAFRQDLLSDLGHLLGLARPFTTAESPVARDHVRDLARRLRTYRNPAAAYAALYQVLAAARPDDRALDGLRLLLP